MASANGSGSELGPYLRARRAAVRPSEVGLETSGKRRVPGLRRDEVALLSGVSAEYYARLEQGRGGRPSEVVLEALGRAMRLDAGERAYLIQLAEDDFARSASRNSDIGTRTRRLIEQAINQTTDGPAIVLDRTTQIVAWNPMARLLLADFELMNKGDRNLARMAFLSTGSHLNAAGTEVQDLSVAILRRALTRPPSLDLVKIVGELAIASQEFALKWATQSDENQGLEMRVFNEAIGEIVLHRRTREIPGSPSHLLVAFVTEPQSPDRELLELLGSWES